MNIFSQLPHPYLGPTEITNTKLLDIRNKCYSIINIYNTFLMQINEICFIALQMHYSYLYFLMKIGYGEFWSVAWDLKTHIVALVVYNGG
jgi:hypothetical protein